MGFNETHETQELREQVEFYKRSAEELAREKEINAAKINCYKFIDQNF